MYLNLEVIHCLILPITLPFAQLSTGLCIFFFNIPTKVNFFFPMEPLKKRYCHLSLNFDIIWPLELCSKFMKIHGLFSKHWRMISVTQIPYFLVRLVSLWPWRTVWIVMKINTSVKHDIISWLILHCVCLRKL